MAALKGRRDECNIQWTSLSATEGEQVWWWCWAGWRNAGQWSLKQQQIGRVRAWETACEGVMGGSNFDVTVEKGVWGLFWMMRNQQERRSWAREKKTTRKQTSFPFNLLLKPRRCADERVHVKVLLWLRSSVLPSAWVPASWMLMFNAMKAEGPPPH